MGLFSFIFFNTDVAFPYAVFSDRWMTGDDDSALQLCEKIISSPENGIVKLDDSGLPVYQEGTNPEREYQYSEMEKGVLQYIRDYRALFGSYDYPMMAASTWLIFAENYLSHSTALDNEILESLDYTATPLTE